jgi:3'-5' exonuclease
MSTLIYCIKTVGQAWDDLSDATKESLVGWLEPPTPDDEASHLRYEAISQGLGYSPFTGQIVALAIYDIVRATGVVYYDGVGDGVRTERENFIYKERTEATLLSEFWEGVRSYDVFVSYNGRRFAAPYLLHRSAIHSLRPSRNLLEGRYPQQQLSCRHVDLQDEFSFYGALSHRPSLQVAGEAYGVIPPGRIMLTLAATEDLYDNGQYSAIAEAAAKEVMAIAALYERWQQHLNFVPLPGEL